MGACSSCCSDRPKPAAVTLEPPVEDVQIVLATTDEVKKLVSEELAPTTGTDAAKQDAAPAETAEAGSVVTEKAKTPTEEAKQQSETAKAELTKEVGNTSATNLVSPPDVSVTSPTEGPAAGNDDQQSPAVVVPAQTKRDGDTGYALIFGQTNQGTLSARWVNKANPSVVAIARVDFEVDEIKLSDPAFDCGKNVRADWMNQAKALCIYLRQCFQQKAEVEFKPEFLTLLPRKAMVVAHRIDGKLVTIKAPAVLDFAEHDVDGISVLPLGADVYKGYTSQKLHQFLEKGVRKGATLRFQ